MKVLIVCQSNSCRSQIAEAYLKLMDDTLEVFSAGSKPDTQVHPMAVEVMREDGIDISDKRPQNIDQFIDQSFDYVLTLCNKESYLLDVFNGRVENKIHLNFEDPESLPCNKMDRIEAFRATRDDIKENFRRFYESHLLEVS